MPKYTFSVNDKMMSVEADAVRKMPFAEQLG